MPMSFSLSGLMLISAAYLLVLFAVAWCADRGLIPCLLYTSPSPRD